jgi:cellulose synthase operon protein C
LKRRPGTTLRRLRPGTSLLFVSLGLVGCGVRSGGAASRAPSSSASALTPAKPTSSVRAASDALVRSDYERAEELFQNEQNSDDNATRFRARRGLAEVALKRGDLERALAFSVPLLRPRKPGLVLPDYEIPGTPAYAELVELGLLHARALRAKGELDGALRTLGSRSAGSRQEAPPADPLPAADQLLLVEVGLEETSILFELGQKEEARKLANELLELTETGESKGATGAQRFRVRGEIAFLLRQPKLAHEAFERAEELLDKSVEPRLSWAWAKLLSERHNVPEALRLLSEALDLAPRDPDALAALAELKLHELFDFGGASRLAEAALKENPTHLRSLAVLGGVALRDLDFEAADGYIARGLAQNPRALPLLSLRAARHFLAEEREALEATLAQIEKLSPNYPEVWATLAELGEFEHRFQDVIQFRRRGVQADRDDGPMRAALGLALSRSESDAAGLLELQKAFELDPFDQRVFNSLELYEKVLPRDYEEFEQGHFRFRFPRAERKLLERYVPKLVETAFSTYKSRYGYEPPGFITVELYQDRQDFAVRTSGLPEVGLEGVCFGRKIASVSPGGGAANLGMTLWHEMAHVFHLGLSNNRVPRWLTEGLAEWETERLGRGWSREVDLDLFRGLREERIPHLDRMNQAFTRAENVKDIGLAYAVAGRLAAFLSLEDEPRVLGALRKLGKKEPLSAVIDETWGDDGASTDARFRKQLSSELSRFESQFTSRSLTPPKSPRKISCEKLERVFSFSEVLELLLQKEPRCALVAETSLATLFATQPSAEVGLLLAQIMSAEGHFDAAADVLDLVFSLGQDGAELRLERAKVAFGKTDLKRAKSDLDRAVALDPKSTEAWLLLAQAELALGSWEGELTALRKLVLLDESKHFIHERYLALLLERREGKEAGIAADNAIWAGLGRVSTHEAAAKAYRLAGRIKDARFEEETVQLLKSAAPPEKGSK